MKRVWTGCIIALALIIAYLLRLFDLYTFDILVGIVTVFSSVEIALLLRKSGRKNIVISSIIFPTLAYLLLILGINWGWGLGKLFVAFVLLLVLSFLVMFVTLQFMKVRMTAEKNVDKFEGSTTKYILKICTDSLFNFIYPTIFLLTFVIINHFAIFSSEIAGIANFAGCDLGLVILLLIVATSAMSDICALYIGKLFGTKKLCPSISPNKTIAGAIGGLVGAIIIGVIAYIILNTQPSIATALNATNISIWVLLIYSLIASAVTQIGDLFESYLKRRANVKDSGKVLPGHGGLMDRFDGVCFNSLYSLLFFVLILL